MAIEREGQHITNANGGRCAALLLPVNTNITRRRQSWPSAGLKIAHATALSTRSRRGDGVMGFKLIGVLRAGI